MNIEHLAELAHEANRALCEAFGDTSQKPWADAEDWQRDSAVKGARATLDGTATSPEGQHDAWCADKVAAGWTFGPVKDAAAKTHPCLVPYVALPPEQRAKDHLFRAVVTTGARILKETSSR
jgi:hypothetical protein